MMIDVNEDDDNEDGNYDDDDDDDDDDEKDDDNDNNHQCRYSPLNHRSYRKLVYLHKHLVF